MEFSASVHFSGRQTLLRVAGELDLGTAGRLAELVEQARRTGRGDLVVDVADVTFMDCAALGVLLRARQAGIRHGSPLCLVNVPRHVRALLTLTGAQDLVGPDPAPSGGCGHLQAVDAGTSAHRAAARPHRPRAQCARRRRR